jgi:cell wall-associated NlpC family hydrolase
VSIPRTSSGQAGLPSVPLSQLQPGDLVTYYSPVSHVAMYIGNGQVIHASTESRPILITSVTGAGPNPTGHRVSG